MKLASLCLFFLFSLEVQSTKRIILLPQYHLSPKTLTTSIDESKSLAQYVNQKAIFLVLDEWIQKEKIQTVISEGCEGEIDQSFKESFNGWNFSSLNEKKDSEAYSDILTLIPLKLEVKYGDKVQTLCADDQELINKHQLIFSNLRGYIGYNNRFKQLDTKSSQYKAFLKSLEESENKRIQNPIQYTAQKVTSLLQEEHEVIKKRNQVFLSILSKVPSLNIAIVIGARHLQDLEKRIKQKGYQVQIPKIIQETLPKGIAQDLKKLKELYPNSN